MSKVVWHITMSVDGFIAGPDDSMDWAFAAGGASRLGDELRDSTGAILAGRRWHDVAMRKYEGRAGIYGGAWEGPVFVITTHPPEDPEDPEIAFLTDGIPDAVATAQEAAGDLHLGVFGANVAKQCIEHGLLDEVVIHLAPVLLGDGVHLYEAPGGSRVELEPELIERSGSNADLRYRLAKRPASLSG